MKFWLFFAKIITFWLFFANFSKFMAIFCQIFEIYGYFPPNFWIFGYFPPKFRNFWPFSAKILKLPSKFTQPTTRRVPGYPIASTRVRKCNTRARPIPDFWYPYPPRLIPGPMHPYSWCLLSNWQNSVSFLIYVKFPIMQFCAKKGEIYVDFFTISFPSFFTRTAPCISYTKVIGSWEYKRRICSRK